MGATHTVLVEGSDTAATGKKIGEIMGDLPEVVLECSGTDPGMQTAIHAVKKGGKVVLVGVAPQTATIPAAMLFVKEADILSAFRYGNNFKNSLAAITAGVVDIKPIATHSLPLEKIVHAMEIASTGQDGALKVMVQPGKI
ncbi:sorbitol dehydrogenase-like [Lingula anatina]|uniref:Sorbitol dehydrogenase-like n=1 Tax=Lingula anatina TaxID=7574 RepID=A0A1S3JS75_LINAN|nr:sorbitol dehydrogenase-like [Lingula anatina]|eukprot:XP_013413238.1 sorbitol dehydrogenase-like [Lingula anatina]